MIENHESCARCSFVSGRSTGPRIRGEGAGTMSSPSYQAELAPIRGRPHPDPPDRAGHRLAWTLIAAQLSTSCSLLNHISPFHPYVPAYPASFTLPAMPFPAGLENNRTLNILKDAEAGGYGVVAMTWYASPAGKILRA